MQYDGFVIIDNISLMVLSIFLIVITIAIFICLYYCLQKDKHIQDVEEENEYIRREFKMQSHELEKNNSVVEFLKFRIEELERELKERGSGSDG